MESKIDYKDKIQRAFTAIVVSLKWIPLRPLLFFLLIQIVLALAAFFLLGIIPVSREVKQMSELANRKSLNTKHTTISEKGDLVNTIRASEHHEAFLKSALNLSKADSMSLLIDLHDSIAILTFKGVYLLEAKISNYTASKGLRKLPLFLRDSLFSGPMQAIDGISSIEKFPIVVKKAPKDTTEASLANAAPTLPKQSDVFFLYQFSNSLVVEIEQEETELVGGRKNYHSYYKQERRRIKSNNLSILLGKEAINYNYRLTIKIPREDARSIFRALPQNPFVVVRYK